MTTRPNRWLKSNDVYHPAFDYTGRYLVLFGGAGSGKSYFLAQKLLDRCMRQGVQHRFLVVRKVGRTIRGSTFQMFRDVINHSDIGRGWETHISDMRLTCVATGSEIIHAGLDDAEKLKSVANITGVWIEEATELSEGDFIQVDLRLRGDTPDYQQIALSFNPISHLHWLKRYFVDDQMPGSYVLKTTWKDNTFAGDNYHRVLSSIRDERLRAVYERGEWGQIAKGLIYTHWDISNHVPENSDIAYGLDFGFNNPTALVRCSRREEEIWVEELLYESELTNSVLIERLKPLIPDKAVPIFCDSAEPQRIEELWRAGFNAVPADKDVNKGIDTVKARTLHIVPGAQNVLNELQTYKWTEDKEGNVLDKPVKFMDHALDATRYAVHTAWGKGPVWLIN